MTASRVGTVPVGTVAGWAGATLLSGAIAAAVLATGSTLAIAGLVGAIAAGIALLRVRAWCPVLLAAVFVLAPIDVSKALVAPLAARFYAAGPYYSPGLYITVAQLGLLVLLPVWLGRRLLIERRSFPITRLDALAFAFLGWIWIRSLGVSQGSLSIATAASYTLSVLGFWVVSHAVETRSDLRIVLRASLVVLAATLLDVVAQTLTGSALTLPGGKSLAAGALVMLGSGGETFRPPGFMNHPNTLAHYLVIVLGPSCTLVLLGRRNLPTRVWVVAVAATLGATGALLVTLSRGGWLAAVVAVAVLLGLCVRRGVVGPAGLVRLAAGSACALAGLLIAYPNLLLRLTAPDGRSLESRGLLVDMAWTIVRAYPWAGVGFGDFNRVAFQVAPPLYANVSDDYQLALHQLIVHNHYLLLASELGVPAALLFCWLLWRFFRQALPVARWRDPLEFGLAIGLAASIAGQAFFLASDNYYVDIRIFLLWLSAGLLQSLVLRQQKQAPARGRPSPAPRSVAAPIRRAYR